MPVEEFKFQKLGDLDNGLSVATFNKLLTAAAQDCWDRPGDVKPREVNLSLLIWPVVDKSSGQIEKVEVGLKITSKVPAHTTNAYSMGLRANGKLAFNPDSPNNVNQATFIREDEDE